MSVLLSVRATPVAHPLILEWVIRRLSEAQPQARRDRGGLPWDAARLMTPASEPIKPVPWSVSSRSMAPDRCSPALLSSCRGRRSLVLDWMLPSRRPSTEVRCDQSKSENVYSGKVREIGATMFLCICNHWRPQPDSNRCCRRERAVS